MKRNYRYGTLCRYSESHLEKGKYSNFDFYRDRRTCQKNVKLGFLRIVKTNSEKIPKKSSSGSDILRN